MLIYYVFSLCCISHIFMWFVRSLKKTNLICLFVLLMIIKLTVNWTKLK